MNCPPDCESTLSKLQEMIRKGNRHFVRRNRNGRDYLHQLFALGLTNIDEAWNCVLELTISNYYSGPHYDDKDIERKQGRIIWVYKVNINGTTAYIKLKDETELRGCVCLSFHEDE